MRNKLIFRADGNADIGLGHLYRLLGFHSLISQMDHYFITRKSSLIHFFPNDIEILFCPESIEKEIEWIKEVFPASESIIVADGYHFDFKYQSELKSLGYKLIIIDDFIQEKYASNVILNPAPISATMDFKGIEVFGIDHALLRTEFIEISKLNRKPREIKNCFISFGGSDLNKISIKVSQMLLEENKFEELHVLAGISVENELKAQIGSRNNVFIHKNLNANQLISVMQKCEIAIVPSSTISYEVLCCGLFVISGTYVDNQNLIYNGLLERNLIFGLGDFNKIKKLNLIEAIDKIIELSQSKQNVYLENQKKFFHGQQKENLNNLISSLR